ncbi:M16 family metallopeptidase [Caminibacter pacificus]|uniref:Insulinase family protein n=1 Tax=Caminibacter pacificus TaxID=1424653 RepID=A0AAJ4UYF6_9BACT|nr:pitrilysin family protein [Caminibacter pacificus]QCI28368.1 insulinase family protein [Caminibacter pacificus]ROR40910.1 putative Zn-dependent peptidase [Caminibacter pacificus]
MLHKFYKTTLKNSLEVIAIPMNRGSKVITSNIFYKVGSRNETLGKTGIAHMLEHMNFKSTKNLKEGDFDKIVKSLGGVDNASTGFDYTHYYIKTSSEYLNKTFELFSEVMQNLNLNDEEFQRERKVVYEERLWRTDNNPIGYLYFRLFNNTFVYHPYHWTPIGFKEDILNWTIEDIKSFHKTFYQPKNAFLLVAGDIDENEVFKQAEKYFADIQNSTEIPEIHQKEPPLDGDKEIVIKRETQVDIVAIAFHIPNFRHEDQFALSAYSEILSGGKSGILREKLINQKALVSEVYAYNMELKDPGVFLALAMVNPGVNPDKVIKEIKKILLNTKITKKDLNKVKNQTKMDFLTHLESSSGVSNIYGDYFAKGDITPLLEYEEKLNALTPQKLEEIKKYFDKSVTVKLLKNI